MRASENSAAELRRRIKPLRDELRAALARPDEIAPAAKRVHMPLIDALVSFGTQSGDTRGEGWATFLERAARALETVPDLATEEERRKVVRAAEGDLQIILGDMNNP